MNHRIAIFQIVLMVLVAFFAPFAAEKECSPNHLFHDDFHGDHTHNHTLHTLISSCCNDLDKNPSEVHHCQSFQLEENVAIACQNRYRDNHLLSSNKVSATIEFSQTFQHELLKSTPNSYLTVPFTQIEEKNTIVLLI